MKATTQGLHHRYVGCVEVILLSALPTHHVIAHSICRFIDLCKRRADLRGAIIIWLFLLMKSVYRISRIKIFGNLAEADSHHIVQYAQYEKGKHVQDMLFI
jgi:hypothetical protein